MPFGKRFLEDAGNRSLGLAGRIAGRGFAVEVCGSVRVVAHRAFRPCGVTEPDHRTKRDHVSGRVADLQLQDVVRQGTIVLVGLGDDLVRSPELVEIVDIKRPR